jgi:HPt (histidine-containing phosphotransfer) domain-containing protein
MAMAAAKIAFEAPDNHKIACPSQSRPVDLVHLAGQTMGDKALEAEVLQMFARQARALVQEMANADAPRMTALAHRLQGAAKAIGAFNVATKAERLEAKPDDAGLLASVHSAVIEADNFIMGLCR